MSPGPWSHVQDAPSGTLEDLLLRIQRAAVPVQPLGGGWWRRWSRRLRALGQPIRRTPTLADALPCLLPKVRTQAEHEAYVKDGGRAAPCCRPLAGNLVVSLVAGFANQDLDLDPAQLTAWNADFDVLLQRARTNLLARGEDRGFQPVREGCYRSGWRDGLDGSRILLPGILRRLRVQGDPVAVLAGHDALLVTGDRDPEGLVWALGTALARLEGDPDARAATPLGCRNGAWERLVLPDGHPAADLLRRLESRARLPESRPGLKVGQVRAA